MNVFAPWEHEKRVWIDLSDLWTRRAIRTVTMREEGSGKIANVSEKTKVCRPVAGER